MTAPPVNTSPPAAAGSGRHAAAELRCVQRCDDASVLWKAKQLHQQRGGVSMHPLFLDFDTLRSSSVPQNRFESVLVTAGITLAPQELRHLMETYAVDGKADRVSYKRFLNDLDRFDMAGPGSPVLTSPVRNDFTSAQILERLLARFACDAGLYGLDLRTSFADFDRLRSGHVTAKQFRRALPFEVNVRESQLLVAEYTNRESLTDAAEDRVNYVRFVADVDAARPPQDGGSEPQAKSPSGTMSAPPAPRGVDEIIAELRREVKQTRLRISESMSDFDKKRCGLITQSQFESCLGRLRLHRVTLDEHALRAIAGRYLDADRQGVPMVRYAQFCQDVDEVFAIKGLEKNPSAKAAYSEEEFKNDPKVQSLPTHEESRVDAVMAKIKNIVSCRRMMLLPTFQDFDRATRGIYATRTTSRTRFERVLALNNIPLSPAEYELLERKYAVSGDPESVNYVLFCGHLDELQRLSPAVAASQGPGKAASTFVNPGRKCADPGFDDLMDDIRTQVMTQRVRVNEFLRDYDKLRSGVIHKAHLASGLSMAGIRLTATEIDTVAAHYAAENRIDGVKWMQFADDVDEVFTTKRLEAEPSRSVGRQATITMRMAQEKEARSTPEMERILAKLQSTVKARGILLPPFFRDFDVHNSGMITANQLAQAMSRHRFDVSPQELQAIYTCYSEPRSKGICWRKLIQDMDEFEDGIGSGFGMTSPKRALPPLERSFSPGRTGSPVGEPATLGETLDEIRGKLSKKRIRMKDFFTDADRMRKGHVPWAKFRTGLDIAGLALTPPQLDLVEGAYRTAGMKDHVDYSKFVADVTADRGLTLLEKSPAAPAAVTATHVYA